MSASGNLRCSHEKRALLPGGPTNSFPILTEFMSKWVLTAEARKDAGGKRSMEVADMTKPKTSEMNQNLQTAEELKGLATLLQKETGRWSRRVILEEAAIKLQKLELELKELERRAS
jgi:hypothetical protein